MKKAILPLLCCLYGMAAFALDEVTSFSGIDFESSSLWGMRPEYGLDDSGNTNVFENTFWWNYGEGDNESIVTNYQTLAERYHGFDPATNPQPSYMHDRDDNQGYAKISATIALARLFKVANATGKHTAVPLKTANDTFIDSLMRFPDISLEMSEVLDSDNDVVDSKFIFGPVHFETINTNRLVVVCGRYAADGTLYRTNYITSVSVEPTRWYRVTARAIYTASQTSTVKYNNKLRNYSAFVLYLDGVPVTCAEEDYSIGDDKSQMDVIFAGNEHYAARALFPMLVDFRSQTPYLKGVAYRGTCELDEHFAVNSGNPLAVPSANLRVVVARDPAKITNMTVRVTQDGAASPYITTNDSSSACITFRLNPSDTIEIVPLTKEGYTAGKTLALSGNKTCYESVSGHVVKLAGEFDDSSQLTITVPVSGAFFKVGETLYETLAGAMKDARDAGNSLIQLATSVTLERDALADNGQMHVLPDDNFIFDLQGHTVKGDHFRKEALLYSQGRLTVYDSVGGGIIEAPGPTNAPGEAIAIVSDNDAVEVNYEHARVVLGDEAMAKPFTVKGRVSCTEGELVIKGGTYLTPKSETGDDFYLAQYVDTERFGWSEAGVEPGVGKYWQVIFGGKLEVLFESPAGFGFNPYRRVTESGSKIEPPTLMTNGYVITRWYRKDTGDTWTFDMPVEESMTLVAETELETYTIKYPAGYEYPPYTYTVETPKTYLTSPTRTHFSFAGWLDTNQHHRVNCVGLDAHYVDAPDCVVTGNLVLAAIWTANPQKWTNADHGQSESNGVYSGELSMVLPKGENSFYAGDKIILDEIAFSIVNPLLYPKTAEYLTIRTSEKTVTSELRDDHFAALSIGMLMGADALANGRPRVAYKFSGGVEVTCGKTNHVYFSTSDGTATSGILRLVRKPESNDRVFGNCKVTGGLDTRYQEYCPVYEVTGHAPEGGDGE